MEIKYFNNSVELTIDDTQITILKPVVPNETNDSEVLVDNTNLIIIDASVEKFGLENGAVSSLLKDDTVKRTIIGLSDDGLLHLHVTLCKYFEMLHRQKTQTQS